MNEPEPGAGDMEGVEPAPVREQLAAAATARLAREAAQLRTCPFTDQPTDLEGFIILFNGSRDAPPAEWLAAPVHLEPAEANPSAVSSAANNPPPAATDDSISAGALVAGALLTTRSPWERSLCALSLRALPLRALTLGTLPLRAL